MKWHDVAEKPLIGFMWVRCKSGMITIAYSCGDQFQVAETVGDREGLSVEYHHDVTHWHELVEPTFVDFEKAIWLAQKG